MGVNSYTNRYLCKNIKFVPVKVTEYVKILFFIEPFEGNPRNLKAFITRIKSSDVYLLGHCAQEQSGFLSFYTGT